MLYIPDSRSDTEALNGASSRGSIRRLAQRIYTDDLDRAAEAIVGENFLAIIGRAYPTWYVSHSTAATLRPVDGVAFISGKGGRTPIKLPGLTIKRLAALPHPEFISRELNILVGTRPRSEPVRASVQMSSPLQTLLEVLSRDSRVPQRTISDEAIRTLLDTLTAEDIARAPAFAKRNGLHAELKRFTQLHSARLEARKTPLPQSEALDLYFYNWRVGRIEALPHGEFRFVYDRDWRIDLSGLPRDKTPAYEGWGLPPFLDNLLPEGWAEARLQSTFKIPREDTFGLLKTTQKYLSNLTLRPDDFDASVLSLDVAGVRLDRVVPDPGEVPKVREAIGRDPDTTELWLELRRRGATRLSGIQPKLPVHVEATSAGLVLSIGDLRTATTHILKFASREYPQLVQNEWAMMELARQIGLRVPGVRQVTFQSGSPLSSPALLIERFDLPASLEAPGEVVMAEDAASLLGIRREEKYDPSHEQVLQGLRTAGLEASSIADYFDHVLYSWLIGNGDLHAKNVSVCHVISPGKLGAEPSRIAVRYSPLYDLVSTRLVITGDGFALPLNGRENNIRVGDFAKLATRWGWSRSETVDRAQAIADRISEHIAGVVERSGLSRDYQERLRNIVRHQIDRLFA